MRAKKHRGKSENNFWGEKVRQWRAERRKLKTKRRLNRQITRLTKQINESDKKFYALVKHANAIENRMRGAVPKEKLAAVINEYHLAANKILRKKTRLEAQRTALQMKIDGLLK